MADFCRPYPKRLYGVAPMPIQDIDMAVSKFDRSSRNLTGTRSIPKLRRNEVSLPARCPYFGNRLFTAFHIPAYD